MPQPRALGQDEEPSQRGADDSECDARKQRLAGLVFAHQLSTVSISLLTMQPRTQLLSRACGGDVSAIARQINRGAALVAVSDFLVSPTMGTLSDRIGRRPCMLLGPAAVVPLKLLVAVRPTAAVLLMERVVCDALRTLTGTTMAYTCLSDLFAGTAYTHALTRLGSATGLAIVLAPLVSAFCARLGSPRIAYLASAALAAAHLGAGLCFLDETLVVGSGAKPQKRDATWPGLGFLRLFTLGARLRARTCLFSLHCFLEGKLLQDQVSIMQLSTGWAEGPRSQWTSGLGLAILSGSQIASSLLAKLGEHGLTALAHATSLLAFICLREKAFWTALLFLSVGQQRRNASTSWVSAEAHAKGIGRGETTGCIASLRSVVDFFAAIVFNRVHRLATKRGRPFDVMLFPCVVSFLAEGVRLRLKWETPH